jgi:hypothetical protein
MMLLIDDARTFSVDIIARTYEAGVKILMSSNIHIDELYIDFDLGEQMTGLDVLKKVSSIIYLPNKITIISMNPSGQKQIEGFLKDHGYEKTESYWLQVGKELNGNRISRY